MAALLECVADAGVGAKLYLVEPLSERADALFSYLAAVPPARFVVPDLFYVECANILWKHVRRFGYPEASARQHLIALLALPLESIPTSELVSEAFELAVAHQLSAYDACYVALSRREGIPLVTADEALVRKLDGTGYDVQSLASFPIPPLP